MVKSCFHKFLVKGFEEIFWNDHIFECVVWFWFLMLVLSFVAKWMFEYKLCFEKWEKNYSRVLERLEEHNLEKFISSFKRSRIHDWISLRTNECGLGFQNEKKMCRVAFCLIWPWHPYRVRGIEFRKLFRGK